MRVFEKKLANFYSQKQNYLQKLPPGIKNFGVRKHAVNFAKTNIQSIKDNLIFIKITVALAIIIKQGVNGSNILDGEIFSFKTVIEFEKKQQPQKSRFENCECHWYKV